MVLPGFLRLYAAASLKRSFLAQSSPALRLFSAALCRSLIEARHEPGPPTTATASFLRLYAAASLKLYLRADDGSGWGRFSAALCRSLIEASLQVPHLANSGHVFCGFMPQPH